MACLIDLLRVPAGLGRKSAAGFVCIEESIGPIYKNEVLECIYPDRGIANELECLPWECLPLDWEADT